MVRDRSTKKHFGFGLALAAVVACATAAQAAIILPTSGSITENFNGMGTGATATLPTDWRISKNSTAGVAPGAYTSAGTATELAAGNNMSAIAGNGLYNYGAGAAASATDRAPGFLATGGGTKTGVLYVSLQAPANQAITSLNIAYHVEKYRNGTGAYDIQLYSSLNGTSWTSAGATFLTSFAANADSNGFATAPGSTTTVSGTLTRSVAAGQPLYLAWRYTPDGSTHNGQGLAIDDVSIANAVVVPEPASVALLAGGVAMVMRRPRRAGRAGSLRDAREHG